MRQFALALQLRHVLLRIIQILEYVGNTYVPAGCLRSYYYILVAGFPSRFVYFCTYAALLPFCHYVIAAVIATVAYWLLNYRLLTQWVFGGNGHVLYEGVLLLMLHGVLQCVNIYGIHILITYCGWRAILAPFGASFLYGCIAVPMTRLIFLSAKKG